jgi:hypothetical protein
MPRQRQGRILEIEEGATLNINPDASFIFVVDDDPGSVKPFAAFWSLLDFELLPSKALLLFSNSKNPTARVA